MARRAKEMLERRDEYNRAQMGMIAACKEWDRKEHRVIIVQGDRKREMIAKSGEVLPYGQDSDIMIAITTLFAEAGCPSDNTVVTSAYALLTRAKLPTNGQLYRKLPTSLKRLRAAVYTFKEGFWNASRKRWTNDVDDFQFFVRLKFRDTEEFSGEVDIEADAPIMVEFSSQFAEQIRKGYIRTVDEKLLGQLKQPTVRALYHFLDSYAVNPETGQRVLSLNFRLNDLYASLGLVGRSDSNFDRLRRMYRALIENGYLSDVIMEGSGESSSVIFVFGSNAREADPALVEALTSEGVVIGVARNLALNHPERVLSGIAYARWYHTEIKVVKNKAALIHDVITNPDKYAREAKTIAAPVTPFAPVRDVEREAQDVALELERDKAAWFSQSVADQAEQLHRKLTLFGAKITPAQAEQLVNHGFDTFELQRAVILAAARHQERQQVVDEALQHLKLA
ncbi:replication initiator protein A [Deinococcus sonorensis]|uniref:Replication initiator protein A n=1 Tax=Deinococcus sonorensis TaxID=309891 RepID=A0ABV8Y9W3_9DEIO